MQWQNCLHLGLYHTENTASITEISQLPSTTPVFWKFERRAGTGVSTDGAIETWTVSPLIYLFAYTFGLLLDSTS
jgi:hypothetical protein